MPGRCCVPLCDNEVGGHEFPTEKELRKKWILAVKRADNDNPRLLWEPKPRDVICHSHFTSEDYKPLGKYGKRRRLKPGVVPSLFPFGKQMTAAASARRERLQKRQKLETPDLGDVALGACVEVGDEQQECTVKDSNSCDLSVQCELLTTDACYRVKRFERDDEAFQYLTGFNSYGHFLMLYTILGPSVDCLAYKSSTLGPQDELFLTLIKLRCAKEDIQLAIDFGISKGSVSQIFKTWVAFMYFELKELELWPSREIVDEYFPTHFKHLFPSTRIILDATEIPIPKLSNCNSQRSTWSSYKNSNTLKTMVGVSPRGIVTYVSSSYGGSVSDRQIIERSTLLSDRSRFNTGDSILADRGLLVQDLFATRDVKVNVPTTMKGRNQLDAKTVIKDRRIASKRIHVERVIGYAKTYQILRKKLPANKLYMGSAIVYVVFMLTNFRSAIVGKNA